MSISDRLDETTEQAARVIGSVMSRWDMDGRPDVDGGIDTLLARTLADAGLLAPDVRWLAENIRNTSKTHGWHSKGDLMRSTLQLVDLILGPDPDPHGPLMIPTPDTDDWDY